jgi:hypothetical protein
MKQCDLLRDNGQRGAQAVLGYRSHRLSVDQHLALLDVVQALQKMDERGLSGSRRSNNTNLLAGRDSQVQVMDRVPAGAIGECHIPELNRSSPLSHLRRIRRVANCLRLTDHPQCLFDVAELLHHIDER